MPAIPKKPTIAYFAIASLILTAALATPMARADQQSDLSVQLRNVSDKWTAVCETISQQNIKIRELKNRLSLADLNLDMVWDRRINGDYSPEIEARIGRWNTRSGDLMSEVDDARIELGKFERTYESHKSEFLRLSDLIEAAEQCPTPIDSGGGFPGLGVPFFPIDEQSGDIIDQVNSGVDTIDDGTVRIAITIHNIELDMDQLFKDFPELDIGRDSRSTGDLTQTPRDVGADNTANSTPDPDDIYLEDGSLDLDKINQIFDEAEASLPPRPNGKTATAPDSTTADLPTDGTIGQQDKSTPSNGDSKAVSDDASAVRADAMTGD